MALDCFKYGLYVGREGDTRSGPRGGWIRGLRIGLKKDRMGVDLAEITKRRASMPFLRKNHQMF